MTLKFMRDKWTTWRFLGPWERNAAATLQLLTLLNAEGRLRSVKELAIGSMLEVKEGDASQTLTPPVQS